jgi:hypothetical protein
MDGNAQHCLGGCVFMSHIEWGWGQQTRHETGVADVSDESSKSERKNQDMYEQASKSTAELKDKDKHTAEIDKTPHQQVLCAHSHMRFYTKQYYTRSAQGMTTVN